MIRATNGHYKGTGDGAVLEGVLVVEGTAVHVTKRSCVREIKSNGLQPMGRAAVQMAAGHPYDPNRLSGN